MTKRGCPANAGIDLPWVFEAMASCCLPCPRKATAQAILGGKVRHLTFVNGNCWNQIVW